MCLLTMWCINSKKLSNFKKKLFVIGLTIIAVLCKEQGIMIIPVIIALDYLKTFDLMSAIKDCLLYGPFLGMISFFRLWFINFKAPTFQEGDNPNAFIQSPLFRLLSYNYVYALNGYLLVLPDSLCYDWAMSSISPIRNLLDTKILAIMCLWVTILRMVQLRKRRLISVSMVLLVIPFLPASNMLVHVGFVIAERILYLSTLGYGLLLAYCMKKFKSRMKNAMITFTIIMFGLKSIHRGKYLICTSSR